MKAKEIYCAEGVIETELNNVSEKKQKYKSYVKERNLKGVKDIKDKLGHQMRQLKK